MVSSETPQNVQDLILSSWAPKTREGYSCALKKFGDYCLSGGIVDMKSASLQHGLGFLAYLFHTKKENYGSIATARSMLSAVLPMEGKTPFGKHPEVMRVMKGIFRQRPQLPRHTVMYDANKVLAFFHSLPDNDELSLELLTKKLITLTGLLAGARAQTLVATNIEFIHFEEDCMYIFISAILKTTRPGRHQKPLVFKTFPDTKLCPVLCARDYLQRVSDIRGQHKPLFLSYAAPHAPINTQTAARYMKSILACSNIDITVFISAHSVRSASTSKANNLGMSLKDICQAAGWSSPHTFQRFYNLPIERNLGQEILNNYSS